MKWAGVWSSSSVCLYSTTLLGWNGLIPLDYTLEDLLSFNTEKCPETQR